MLWYSTARTDPEEIILSKERNGLIARDDIEEKMYGTAIYFSKNASFCASDTFISKKGERKMFYADVLLGD